MGKTGASVERETQTRGKDGVSDRKERREARLVHERKSIRSRNATEELSRAAAWLVEVCCRCRCANTVEATSIEVKQSATKESRFNGSRPKRALLTLKLEEHVVKVWLDAEAFVVRCCCSYCFCCLLFRTGAGEPFFPLPFFFRFTKQKQRCTRRIVLDVTERP